MYNENWGGEKFVFICVWNNNRVSLKSPFSLISNYELLKGNHDIFMVFNHMFIMVKL